MTSLTDTNLPTIIYQQSLKSNKKNKRTLNRYEKLNISYSTIKQDQENN